MKVNPGGAEKVDWYAPTKTEFVITGVYTDDKGGQVVAVDYPKSFDKGVIWGVSMNINLRSMFLMCGSVHRD